LVIQAFKMKVSLVTRYPYRWHNITVTDDVNLKNSFFIHILHSTNMEKKITLTVRMSDERIIPCVPQKTHSQQAMTKVKYVLVPDVI
jgi:hypothetical protein